MHSLLHSSYETLFRTKDGNIVIAQRPNAPIIGFFACAAAAFILRHTDLHTGLQQLGRAFLFLWAYQELTQGVNLFRRLLGGVVLVITILSFFQPT